MQVVLARSTGLLISAGYHRTESVELLWTAILDTGYSGNLEHSTSGRCTEDFNVTGVSNGVSTGTNCERFGNLSQYHHFRRMYWRLLLKLVWNWYGILWNSMDQLELHYDGLSSIISPLQVAVLKTSDTGYKVCRTTWNFCSATRYWIYWILEKCPYLSSSGSQDLETLQVPFLGCPITAQWVSLNLVINNKMAAIFPFGE